jgi:methyl-accepting chemotaxis protein
MQAKDFARAVIVHHQWKTRLRAFMRGSGEVLDPAKIEQDCNCELGKWLYGDGTVYCNEPEYKEVLACHAEFHRHAAEIVRQVKAADMVTAAKLLEAGSKYSWASNSTILGLTALKRRVKNLGRQS